MPDRLAGFKYRDVAKRFRALGFAFARQSKGSHEQWRHPDGRQITLFQHPGDFPAKTLRLILNQAKVSVDEFLAAK